MRFAELEHANVAVWGYGREGRSVLAALRQPVLLLKYCHGPIW